MSTTANRSLMLTSHARSRTTALCAIPLTHRLRSRAVEAARECLRISKAMSDSYQGDMYTWTVCCHWVLLRTPLTPFTCIFYNILADPACASVHDDLALLEGFVAALELARKFSDGVDKFHNLCGAFVEVARMYLKVKSNLTSGNDSWGQHGKTTSAAEPPATEGSSDGAENGLMELSYGQNGGLDFNSLMEWCSQSSSMYGLLDQGLGELGGIIFDDFDGGQ